MSPRPHMTLRIAALAAVLASVVAVGGLGSARAQDAASPTGGAGADQLTASLGVARVSLDASANAVPVSGTFRFATTVSADAPVEYLQSRMRLTMPSGDLVYQKTFVDQLGARDSRTFVYERTLEDIGLAPGLYPVEMSVRLSASGDVTETVLNSSLIVYDPSAARLPLSVVARITAQPLSDPDGRFTSDPAQFTRARDDALKIAEYVLAEPDARVALSLNPAMLEEWRRIGAGYSFSGAEGEVMMAAGDDVPRAYASALNSLARAAATGRLEVLSVGFSDPDPSELAAARLTEDLAVQYERGSEAVASALEATPSVGTAPAGGALPQTALPSLSRAGVRYVIVSSHRVRRASKAVEPGHYRSQAASVTVLAADARLARTIEESPTSQVRVETYQRLMDSPRSPVTMVFDVGPGAIRAEAFVAAVGLLGQQPWSELRLPSEAAATPVQARVSLRAHRADTDAPPDFWTTAAEARSWARALSYALGEDDSEAQLAVRNSLIAQSSVWAGFDGGWTPAGKGLGYAANVLQAADAVFGQVDLSAKSVTLAGNSGRVPVTIDNGTERPLRVVMTARPGAALRLGAASRQVMVLEPGENFVEVPVVISNALAGDLTVDLSAAGESFASTKVTVRASYLDRVVIVIGVVAALGLLLAFIIRRVSTAEADEERAEQG